tara:strand:+ start:39 stop:1052 length:1014 start_codon:yes stop_codon:yes gene_type:complete
MKINNKVITWLNISMIVLFLMIIIGGTTRLTDSGLSMVSWKPITGIFPPVGLEEWQNSFNDYKSFPEYKIINYNISLSEYKSIYYWEYLHRLLGRIIGLLFLIPFLYFLYKGFLNKQLIKKLLILFFMGGFQGFLGWYMVKSGLVDIPHVSHYRLALHLSLAFFILSYIYKLKLSLLVTKLSKDCNYKYYDRLISIIIGLLFIQIVYGAFNAGLKTVNTVNTFPFYNGFIFPSSNISFDSFWLFFFENHYGVQIIHRFLGLMIMGLIMFFSYKSSMSNSRIKLESQYLIVLILFQCIVGILTLISDASIVFALLHQFLAILTILFTIKIKHKLRYEK